jgi:hypothetical protein
MSLSCRRHLNLFSLQKKRRINKSAVKHRLREEKGIFVYQKSNSYASKAEFHPKNKDGS